MRQKTYIFILAILALLNSCTKENLNTGMDSNIPVVEAYLEPGNAASVKLSKMLPFSENEYPGSLIIDSAEVYIGYNGADYICTPIEDEPGMYISLDSNLIVEAGAEYSLSFEYNDYTVTSTTSVPSKPVNADLSTTIYTVSQSSMMPGLIQEPLTVTWDNPDNAYHIIIVEYMESSYNPIRWNMDPETFDQFRKISTEPVSGDSYNLDTRKHLLFYGSYQIHIYKVNEEYVNLYENISQNSLNLTEPLTNIKNGLGIFTGINSVTLYLEVVYF